MGSSVASPSPAPPIRVAAKPRMSRVVGSMSRGFFEEVLKKVADSRGYLIVCKTDLMLDIADCIALWDHVGVGTNGLNRIKQAKEALVLILKNPILPSSIKNKVSLSGKKYVILPQVVEVSCSITQRSSRREMRSFFTVSIPGNYWRKWCAFDRWWRLGRFLWILQLTPHGRCGNGNRQVGYGFDPDNSCLQSQERKCIDICSNYGLSFGPNGGIILQRNCNVWVATISCQWDNIVSFWQLLSKSSGVLSIWEESYMLNLCFHAGTARKEIIWETL